MIRLGIIGAGAVAHFHAASAARISNVELAAVCDLRDEAAQRVASPWGASVYGDYRAMFREAGLHAVIINTPHALHLEMVVAAADHGLHVLVEKPMATTIADCDRMIRACDEAGVALVIGQIQHFLPEKLAAEEVLASGELGRVLMIRDYRTTDYRPGSRPDWFFSESMAGGGALMNIGGHCLDRSIWFGGAAVGSLNASTLNRFGVPVETDGAIALTLRNGVHVSISVVSDAAQRVDEVLVVCEHGTISCSPHNGTLVRSNGATRTVWEPQPEDIQQGFFLQLQDFVTVLDGGTPKVSVDHARHIVEVVLASYEAATSGNPVVLNASRDATNTARILSEVP
ncbi:Gfo/Idh/MocA family oxidoreductase [Paenarthrobacter sp. OM7]|uniref:Gfo/Idh/MocA family protein n=1 Tax=Paenarthrobacter sp. OM7 TaxID=3041264 RepID=UPI002468C4C1|nr:Gfo/Idh/MocA family oxidoreductase [Paenarthrobacter sp. OM7]WGM19734.1 Gfo/Idh/MocA family oxidoreductase [Paenarthrobacter sp. OM7]